MNIDSKSDTSEPPGEESSEGFSNSMVIEFNLDDVLGQDLDDQADESELEAFTLNWLNHENLSLDIMRSAIRAALEMHEVDSAEISVAIVTGPEMRKLNQQYLQHDFDTDVLSFCLSDPEANDLLGQLIVSLDYARSQVLQLKELSTDYSVNDELALYLVHGTLHLLGYDDHEDADRLEMRQTERQVLGQVGIVPCWPAEDLAEGTIDE